MFKFNPENEYEMFRRLDELRALLELPSRGLVVELAIRLLAAVVVATRSDETGLQRVRDETL